MNEGLLFLLLTVVSVGLTEIVRRVAIRFDFVNRPAAQRWSTRVVALGGGVAICLTITLGFLLTGGPLLYRLLPAFLMLFALGFIDDIWGVPPAGKLLVQTIAATFVAATGYVFPLPWPIVSIPLTILWTVGVTNAVNLIDNMDGLAAGAAMIAASGVAYLLTLQSDPAHAAIAIAVAAGAAGFLAHNFHPARIFMGDAGSLALGFLLAVLSTKLRFHGDIQQGFTLVPVVLLLVVPLFDTALVSVSRRNAGRPIMSGGRDHTSHRLVRLGLSETRSVLVLYALGAFGFCAAKLALESSGFVLMLIGSIAGALVMLLGSFFLDMAVYPPKDPTSRVSSHRLPSPILFAVEIAVDVCVVSVAWTAAHYIRFEDYGGIETYKVLTIIPILPYLISAKLVAFYAFKLYRGIWRTIGVRDVSHIFYAVSVGSVLFLTGIALATRLQDLSRIVVVLDWVFTFIGILAARAAIRTFGHWSRRLSTTPYKAVLLGPSALVGAVRKAVSEDRSIDFAGVIDPDASGQVASGAVLGSLDQLESIVREKDIDMVYVAGEQWDGALPSRLAALGVGIRHVKIVLD